MAKRTKTYSLDDTAIELVQVMASQSVCKQSQSGFINRLIYVRAERITKSNPMYQRIQSLLRKGR